MPDNISGLIDPKIFSDLNLLEKGLQEADAVMLKLIQDGKNFVINPESIASLLAFNEAMKKVGASSKAVEDGLSVYNKMVLAAQKAEIAAVNAATRKAEAEEKAAEKSILAAQKAEIAQINSATKKAEAEKKLSEQKAIEEQKAYDKMVLAAQRAEIKQVASSTAKTQKEIDNAKKRTDAEEKSYQKSIIAANKKAAAEIAAYDKMVIAAERKEMKEVASATRAAEKLILLSEKKKLALDKENSAFNQLELQYKKQAALVKNLAVEYILLEEKIKGWSSGQSKTSEENRLRKLGVDLKIATAEAQRLDAIIKQVNASVGQHHTKVGSYTQGIAGYFNNMKTQFMGYISMMLGAFAIISKIREGVKINAELSDSFADLKIRIHGTNQDVAQLVETLKQLDTRTSLTGLVDIAAIIAKKGVAKDEIAGVTKAVDDLMIAVGKEMGDPHEAVSSLIKLSTIYNDDKNVTAKKIIDIGNAVQKLTSSGIATGQYLIQFAEQMGGIRGVTHMTIDSVLGLGAALEALGQTAHVSSTALSQVIVKLFTEQQKYADITKNSLSDFKTMLHDDVLGTLLLVAQAIKGDAAEMEHFFEGMVDMHAKGYRAVGVIGDLAAAIPYAKEQMAKATAAMKDQNRTMDAASEKQHTFAATLNRVHKAFEMASANKGFVNILNAIGLAIIFLIQNIPTLLTLGALLLVNWIAQNTTLIILRAQVIGYNLALFAMRIAYGFLITLQTAYTVGMALMTGTIRAATAATILFNNALRLSPLGVIAGILGLVVAAFELLYLATYKSTHQLTKYGRELFYNHQILEKVNEATVETSAKIKMLTDVVKDNTVSIDIRNKALKDLISLAPEYLSALTLENLKTAEGTALLDKYVDSLKKKAAQEAAQNIQSDILRKDVNLQSIEYALEKKKKEGKIGKSDLSEEIDKSVSAGVLSSKYNFNDISMTYVDWLIEKIKKSRVKLKGELDVIGKIIKDKYIEIAKDSDPTMGDDSHRDGRRILKDIDEDIAKQEKIRDNTNAADKQHIAALRELVKLEKERSDYLGQHSKDKIGKSDLTPYQKELDGYKKLLEALEKLEKDRLSILMENERAITEDVKQNEEERKRANISYYNAKIELANIEFQKEIQIEKLKIEQSIKHQQELETRLSELKRLKPTRARKGQIENVKSEIENENVLQQSYLVNQEDLLKVFNAKFTQAMIDEVRKQKEIHKSSTEEWIKNEELRFSQQKTVELNGYLQQELALKEQFDNKLLSKSQYRKALLDLQKKENEIMMDADIKFYEAILSDSKLYHTLSLEEEIEYQKKLNAAKQRKFDDQNQPKPKKGEGFRLTDPLVDLLNDLGGSKLSDDELLNAKKQFWAKTVELAETAYSAMKTMRDNAFAQEQMNIQNELRMVQLHSQQKINAIDAESDYETSKNNKKQLLVAQTTAKENELQKQENQLSLKKARADKQAAEMEILARTAMAIVSTYAAYASIPGGIFIASGIAGILAGIGAAQYSAASSAPLPQYWMGTEGTTTPLFSAGERGFELITPPDGKPAYFSSNTASVYNEKLGTKVTTHENTVKMIQYAVGNVIGQKNDIHDRRDLIKETAKEVAKIIGNKFEDVGGELAYVIAKSQPNIKITNTSNTSDLNWSIK